ncbi:hypothetical protein Sjap_008641 [Stephania japonica]|uniref:NAC domain-containing protein n=1 Tax=Stephania japonica TaxID=461633 RepID=A0AAP0JSB0_9MAGN
MDYLNQLPWGFTFSPTDEELICYLEAKSKNSALPFIDPIIDFDVYTAKHPSQLHMQPGTKVFNHQGAVIGHRRSLVYYIYDSPLNDDEKKDKVIEKEDKKSIKSSSNKTNWIMNEFRLPDPYPKSKSSSKVMVVLPIEQLEQYPQFDQTVIDHQEEMQMSSKAKNKEQQRKCDVDNVNVIGSSVPQQASDLVEQPAELLQHPQFDDIEVTDDEFDGYIQQLLQSSCDSWPQIEESNNQLQPLLQQSSDDEDGVPGTLWLDETQLGCCDEKGNLLNPPTKCSRVV